MAELKGYAQLITQSDEAMEKAKLNHEVEQSKYILSGAISTANQHLSKAEIALQEQRRRVPLDPQALQVAVFTRDDAKRKVETLTAQFNDLFPG